MFQPNEKFPTRPLPSSKGGTTDLADTFGKGTTIVGVIPQPEAAKWLEAVSERFVDWMMYRFWNVYLILDVPPEDARFLCDTYGVQATVLCDTEGAYLPGAAGIYRVGSAGVIEKAVSIDGGTEGLAALEG